ncbi:MAG: FAD-binding dehydrogenase [Cyclobacteriaceae bacterium]|nr:FAD-binding dehydrogenase [Cyclobacteriaceae bacterium]
MALSYQSDVVIVGGGIAGITAAIELLNFDKEVLIIDRDTEQNLGGLAKESFGGMFFVDTPQQRRAGIRDTPELAFRDWCSVAQFDETDVLPKAWAKTYVYNCTSQVYEWLKSNGVGFFPVVHWVERGLFKPGNSYPRFHMVWGTGSELTNVLVQKLLNHPKAKSNLKIVFEHKVEVLIEEGGKIIGVTGIDEVSNTVFEAKAEHTIVAAGGMGGNMERVRKNWYKPWGKPPETILNGAHKYALGDLHDAVENKEGVITHLDKNWPYAAGVHHPRPLRQGHGLSLVPPKSALWLDYTGRRFGPMPLITAYDTRYCVEQICKQEKKYSWQVLNMKIAYKEFAISGSESNKAMREKSWLGFIKTILFGNKELVHDMLDNCEDFVVADTIEELVDKMNAIAGTSEVKLEHVREAIQNYDAQIDRGKNYFNDEQLRRIAHARRYRGDKVRTSKFQKIADPKAGKLMAIREFILSRKTLGGIQTNLDCQVMGTNGKPIEGLFAAGEVAGFGGGGMHGLGTLEGTFLGGCVLTGRVAAYSIAGKKLIE